MKSYVIAICVWGLAMNAIPQGTTENQADRPVKSSTVEQYQALPKAQLQEELRKLQSEVLVMDQKLSEVRKAERRPMRAYQSASDDQKPDKLIAMLDAQSRTRKAMVACGKVNNEFRAAQQAYLQLLWKESDAEGIEKH